MALVVGTNSYATSSEANTYFYDRYSEKSWADISSVIKEKLLISAADVLDNSFKWLYDKTDDAQNMEFPRNDETEVPEAIKMAQYELAMEIYLSKNSLFVQNPKLVKTDKVTTEFYEDADSFPEYVKSLVSELGTFISRRNIKVVKLIR